MILCRKCAHTVRFTTLRCPRCGWLLPYWRSRRWKPELDLSGPAWGKHCPRCRRRTVRQRPPLWFRPLRLLTLGRSSYRTCTACGWRGPAFHRRRHAPARPS
jgi:hypothetical protein